MQASTPHFSNTSLTLLPRVHLSTSLKSTPTPALLHLRQNHYSLSTSFFLCNHFHLLHKKMAEHRREEQPHRREEQLVQRPTDALKSIMPEKGPSKSQVLAVVTGLPAGGFLLLLAGLTLTGTLIGLALATPLFVIFSPILVPAALTLALAVCGFLTSGVFGITALSSLSWIVNYLRTFGHVPEQLEHAKRKAQDVGGQMGLKTREMGQKTQEAVRT